MRPIFFALPLLAATAALAQARPANPPVTNAGPSFIVPAGMLPCPVGMRAQRSALGQTIWTISLEDASNPPSQPARRSSTSGVHVELKSPKEKAIRQVELAVYFTPPGARILQIQGGVGGGDTPNLKKTFHLSAAGGAVSKLAGDLLVGPAASITRVRLLSIDYADGASWRAHGANPCSIAPDGFMLIGAQSSGRVTSLGKP